MTIINSLNPTGSIFVNYNPASRADATLGPNLVTYAETAGLNPEADVIVYRGIGNFKQSTLNSGDYVTTNPQLAKDYGDGRFISQKVKAKQLIDDKTEPLGEEYLYIKYPKLQQPRIITAQIPKKIPPNIYAYKGKTLMFQLRESNTHLRIIAGAGLKLTQEKTSVWNKQGVDITPLVAEVLGVKHSEGKGIYASNRQQLPELMLIIQNILEVLDMLEPKFVNVVFIADARGGRINQQGHRV